MWWGKVRTKHFLTTSCNDQVLLDTKCRIKCEQHSVPNVPIINTNTRINCEHSVKILYSAELFSLVELSYTCPDHPLPPISLSHWTRQSWSYCQKHQSAQKSMLIYKTMPSKLLDYILQEISSIVSTSLYLSSSSCGILNTSGSCWQISYNFYK